MAASNRQSDTYQRAINQALHDEISKVEPDDAALRDLLAVGADPDYQPEGEKTKATIQIASEKKGVTALEILLPYSKNAWLRGGALWDLCDKRDPQIQKQALPLIKQILRGEPRVNLDISWERPCNNKYDPTFCSHPKGHVRHEVMPIHAAIYHRNLPLLQMLVDYGARIDTLFSDLDPHAPKIVLRAGKTAFDLIQSSQLPEVEKKQYRAALLRRFERDKVRILELEKQNEERKLLPEIIGIVQEYLLPKDELTELLKEKSDFAPQLKRQEEIKAEAEELKRKQEEATIKAGAFSRQLVEEREERERQLEQARLERMRLDEEKALGDFRKDLKTYATLQCTRLDTGEEQKNPPKWKNFKNIERAIDEAKSLNELKRLTLEMRDLSRLHREGGWMGLFKLNCFRWPQSYHEYYAHFNQDDTPKGLRR